MKFRKANENILDVFSLKILGLLACKDPMHIKELMFVKLVIQGETVIDCDNLRLRRAVKKIFYFSEIMPKKYFHIVD